MNVAIIPARGGSKRIPRKNVREFCGRPMLAWSIETARQSGLFEHVVVSTDDAEIRTIAGQWGAEVPFERPADLANDHAGTVAVMRHAVAALMDLGWQMEKVCCLYATAPLLLPMDLHQGHELLNQDADVDFVFAVASYDFPIQRAVRLEADARVAMVQPEHEMTRSQDLPSCYHDAGQFYWARPTAWLELSRIYSARSKGLVLPSIRVQDIDTEEDWQMAEWKWRYLHEWR